MLSKSKYIANSFFLYSKTSKKCCFCQKADCFDRNKDTISRLMNILLQYRFLIIEIDLKKQIMKMKTIKLIIFFLLIQISTTVGQSIDIQILSSTSSLSNQNSKLEYTMGELMVEEFKNDNILTQGFYQGKIIITNIESIIPSIKIEIYPNPFMSSIKIDITEYKNVKIELFDLKGKIIKAESLIKHNNQLDMSGLISGTYILRVIKNNALVKTARVIKIK